MDQEYPPPMEEDPNPYDNANGGEAIGRNTEEHAYDNATYEQDTGETTTVDMPPPPDEPAPDPEGYVPPPDEPAIDPEVDMPPSDAPDDDVVINAEADVAGDVEPGYPAVIDVNTVNGDEVVDPMNEEEVDMSDGDGGLPGYSVVDENAGPDMQADPLPMKSREDSRKYESIRGLPMTSTDKLSEEEHKRKERSIKICLGMLVVVLVATIVSLVSFYVVYSMGQQSAVTQSPTTTMTTVYSMGQQSAVTQSPTTTMTTATSMTPTVIMIDNIAVELNLTFKDFNFTDALNNPNSTEYQELLKDVLMLLNGILGSGDFSNSNATVLGFSPGSIVVILVIDLDSVPEAYIDQLENGADYLGELIGGDLAAVINDGLAEQNYTVEVTVGEVIIEEVLVPTTVSTTSAPDGFTGDTTVDTTGETTTVVATPPPVSTTSAPDGFTGDTTVDTTGETTTVVTTPPPVSTTSAPDGFTGDTTVDTTGETTSVVTTPPPVACPNGTFSCPEPEATCIDNALLCDFVPHCRLSRADEAEDLCQVSLLTEDVLVPFRKEKMLMTPATYPSRDIDTPLEYILYRLTSPSNSHLFIELIEVTFSGVNSFLSIGTGLDPVQAVYDSGILLNLANGVGWDDSRVFPLSTPSNESYILLERAKGEGIEINIMLSSFQCTFAEAIPCENSKVCYLPSQICDGEVQCSVSGQDEAGCPSPLPPYCFNCSTPWGNNTCLPSDWVCDGTQDCLDSSDEMGCPTPPACFECESSSSCVYLDWVCDDYDDCYNGEDELNCPVTCASDTFSCPEPETTCIADTLLCDFVPHCRATAADETEDLCQVSQISEDFTVLAKDYMWLETPSSYPSRDVDAPGDHLLHRGTSPPNSHMLIEVIDVIFSGDESSVSIGSGLDPVQAFYDSGMLLKFSDGSGWDDAVPFRLSTPANEAYILLQRAEGEKINFTIRMSSFQCTREGEIPCLGSNDCYLLSEICDGTVQCELSEEDEQSCTSTPPSCFNCTTPWGNNTCLASDWICDGIQDCLDNSDETDCPSGPPCFECISHPKHNNCISLDWICDGEIDCVNGTDEVDCDETPAPCYECDTLYPCVSVNWICDGDNDCINGEDEQNCNASPAPPSCFNCTTPWGNDSCLSSEWICDGTQDCLDNSDETDCPSEPPCFECVSHPKQNNCISVDWLCDGEIDCVNGTDEIDCEETPAPCYECDTLYPCVSVNWICDGDNDCINGEDEQNCNAPPSCFNCSTPWGNNTCLPSSWICDGTQDCLDNSDETDCPTEPSCFECMTPRNNTICISLDWVCDGEIDCVNGTDEVDCSGTPAPCYECDSLWSCVRLNWTCDGEYDCIYGEDEQNCNATGAPPPCFNCSTAWGNNTCLSTVWVCDGVEDCLDGSDETDCQECVDYIPSNWVCDGIQNCLDNSDETDCQTTSTPNTTMSPCFDCESLFECVQLSWVCDDRVDCYDGSDELPEICGVCGANEYSCYFEPETCFNASHVCDGVYDCPGSVDEFNCTGCFACPGDSVCLSDLQVCNYYSDCPGGEDEAESLCKHSEYTTDVWVDVGEWVSVDQGYVRERVLGDRDTPASNIYEFTHFVFNSAPGTTLYAEIQNLTLNVSGPLLPLVRVSLGSGTDPTDFEGVRAYLNEYGVLLSISETWNFSLTNNVGYALIAFPSAGVDGFMYTQLRVTAIECESPEFLCNGSPHCYNWVNETCDGEVQCLDSMEDELGCDDCSQGATCYFDDTCFLYRDVCDGVYDCPFGEDEFNCTGCFGCPGSPVCLIDAQVCDFYKDCPGGEDEAESLCAHSNFITEIDVPTGEWLSLEVSSAVAVEDRGTPASQFYDFTHYMFSSAPGATLFMELQNVTLNPDSGPLLPLFRIFTGPGSDATYSMNDDKITGYIDGLGNSFSISNTYNFSLTNNTGYAVVGIPKGVEAYVMVLIKPVECESPEMLCYGSPHCLDRANDTCDGEVQCLYSEEDEYNCDGPPACVNCTNVYDYETDCIPPDWICDGTLDCFDETDELFCASTTPPSPTPPPTCFNCSSPFTCVYEYYVCDGYNDCNDGSDEWNCNTTSTTPPSPTPPPTCFNCSSLFSCVYEYWVCDTYEDCFDGSDEWNCSTTTTTSPPPSCFNCSSPFDCVVEEWVCDGILEDCHKILIGNIAPPPPCFECDSDYCVTEAYICDDIPDCLDGLDEWNCGNCDSDQLECYYGNTCVQLNETCDGYYDCPGGVDEYNCTGCFACPGSSDCLYDVQVCDYYNHCPGGEDEAESLCAHSEFMNEIWVPTGEWVTVEQTSGAEQARATPASNSIEFTHYVFFGEPGTTLFMELQNYAWTDGPLVPLLRIYAGKGADATYTTPDNTAYLNGAGYVYSISKTLNFTLLNSTGYALIGFPQGIDAYAKFRVTAIACESPETLCYGSPHCLDWANDTCDGEVQCLNSEEDEYDCDGCEMSCYYEEDKCLEYSDYCDGEYDCTAGEDEYNCTGCFACPGSSECLLDSVICDFYHNCLGGEDEAESLCQHSQFINEIDVPTGEWVTLEQSSRDAVPDRDTPASKFYAFTHYVFNSAPGSTLFMELQNYTWSANVHPVLPILRIVAGAGTDPASPYGTRAYLDAAGRTFSISDLFSFSLTNDTGFGLLAFPNEVSAYVKLRVTAVDCSGMETPCLGSPHCYGQDTQTCDGIVQCSWSYEDEIDCPATTLPPATTPEPCLDGEFQCVNDGMCISGDQECDNIPDCLDYSDELQCSCPEFKCPSSGECISSENVCDLYQECINADDERSCGYDAISTDVSLGVDDPYMVNTINPEAPVLGSNIQVALWRFTAPDTSYVIFFDVSASYNLPSNSEAVIGPGTDFIAGGTASYYPWGSATPSGKHVFYVLRHEAFARVRFQDDVTPYNLSFSATAEQAPVCAGGESLCVICQPRNQSCQLALGCSQESDYFCPSQ